MSQYWGYHLVIDASGCDHDAITSGDQIRAFCKELVRRIDMVAYGPPQVVMFGEGGKKGYTLVQLIETSNITAHFVEETNDIYLDVFSCKEFDPMVVEEVVKGYFMPATFSKRFIKRQALKYGNLNTVDLQ
jgi:S-adenosylmethionine/arginine decarboxylase-like enzyme